jgi:hypothetical protein
MQFRYFILIIILTASISLSAQEGGHLIDLRYHPADELFLNPERGFYRPVSHRGGYEPLDVSELEAIRNDGYSLIYRSYYFPGYRDIDLSDEILNLIDSDFNIIREAGLKSIFRFRYSVQIGEPDAPLDIVKRHLDQLKPILEEHYDVIAVMQAGFIGAWGEWHASTNELTTLENKTAILEKILAVLPPDRMTQLRYPSDKIYIFRTDEPLSFEQAYDQSNIARTGHHNDCFLASSIDVGTYRISPVTEKEYLNKDTRFVPMGGETCSVRDGERYRCETALVELKQMRWSYLNSAYYRGILNTWIEEGCMEEVQMRLGYRFELVRGKYSETVQRGGGLSFEFDIYNYGWAAPFNPRRFEVLLRSEADGGVYSVLMPDDPRFWLGGDTVTVSTTLGIPEDMPAGSYELLVHFPDPVERLYGKPEYSIRLANEDVWEPETGFNKLLHIVGIEDGKTDRPYDGELNFVLNPTLR